MNPHPDVAFGSGAISPNGALLAAGGAGGLQLWSARTLTPGLFIPAPNTGLIKIAFDPASGRIVGAGDDGTARLWRLSDGAPIGVLSEPGAGAITSASFSPDGRLVLTASQDGTARLWNATTDTQIRVFAEPGGAALTTAAFDRTGRLIATGSQDGSARIWDATSGQQLVELDAGRNISDLAFAPDGRSLLIAAGAASVWSTELAQGLPAITRIATSRLTRGLTAAERTAYLLGVN